MPDYGSGDSPRTCGEVAGCVAAARGMVSTALVVIESCVTQPCQEATPVLQGCASYLECLEDEVRRGPNVCASREIADRLERLVTFGDQCRKHVVKHGERFVHQAIVDSSLFAQIESIDCEGGEEFLANCIEAQLRRRDADEGRPQLASAK